MTNISSMIQSKVLESETVHFDPLKDFTPIGSYWASVFVIVVPAKAPYKNVKELIEYQKKNPAPDQYGLQPGQSLVPVLIYCSSNRLPE